MSDTPKLDAIELRLMRAWKHVQELQQLARQLAQRMERLEARHTQIETQPMLDLAAELPALTQRVQAIENWIPKPDEPSIEWTGPGASHQPRKDDDNGRHPDKR